MTFVERFLSWIGAFYESYKRIPTPAQSMPVEDTAAYVLGHLSIFPRQRSSPSTVRGAQPYEIHFSLP